MCAYRRQQSPSSRSSTFHQSVRCSAGDSSDVVWTRSVSSQQHFSGCTFVLCQAEAVVHRCSSWQLLAIRAEGPPRDGTWALERSPVESQAQTSQRKLRKVLSMPRREEEADSSLRSSTPRNNFLERSFRLLSCDTVQEAKLRSGSRKAKAYRMRVKPTLVTQAHLGRPLCDSRRWRRPHDSKNSSSSVHNLHAVLLLHNLGTWRCRRARSTTLGCQSVLHLGL